MSQLEETEQEVTVILPDAPKCRKCGHRMCPECRTWCDVLNGPNDFCCGGKCDPDPDELAAWQEKMSKIEIPEFARLVYESENTEEVAAKEGDSDEESTTL